jgi:hypothetical protein
MKARMTPPRGGTRSAQRWSASRNYIPSHIATKIKAVRRSPLHRQ